MKKIRKKVILCSFILINPSNITLINNKEVFKMTNLSVIMFYQSHIYIMVNLISLENFVSEQHTKIIILLSDHLLFFRVENGRYKFFFGHIYKALKAAKEMAYNNVVGITHTSDFIILDMLINIRILEPYFKCNVLNNF